MSVPAKNNRKGKPDITNLIYGKVPPQAVGMERAVLSALINDGKAIERIRNMVPSSDIFYTDECKCIWNAIHRLYAADKVIDLLTVTDQLRKDGNLEIVGGVYGVTQLATEVFSSAHIVDHLTVVLEQHFRREIIRLAASSICDAYDEGIDVFQTRNKLVEESAKITELKLSKPTIPTHEIGINYIKTLLEKKDKDLALDGLITGFPNLNDIMGGWHQTDVVVIAGRPGTGKTAFAINTAMAMAYNYANNPYGGEGVFFSLEMPAQQIIARMMTCISGVSNNVLKSPSSIQDSDFKRLNESVSILQNIGIHIVDDMDEIGQIVSKLRTMKAKKNIKWAVIDYLQLMKGNFEGKESRDQQISKITRELKKLAIELDIVLIELSQMSRDSAKLMKEPELTDLRDSGAIEQDADMVMFLYHPTDKMVNDKPKVRGMIMCSIKKFRNGASNVHAVLHFKKEISRFVDSDWIKYDDKGKASYDRIPDYCMPEIESVAVPVANGVATGGYQQEVKKYEEASDDFLF